MTRHFTNFEDADIGDNPPVGWTRRGNALSAPSSYLFTLRHGTPAFKRREVVASASAAGQRSAISHNASASDGQTTSEVLLLVYIPASGVVDSLYVYLRGTGDLAGAYVAEFSPAFNAIATGKLIGGVFSYLGGASSYTFTASQWHFCRFRIEGSSVMSTAWPAGDTVPTTWAQQFTDTDVSGPGYVAWGGYSSAGTKTIQVNAVSIANGGDSAVVPLLNTEFRDWMRQQDVDRCVISEMNGVGYVATGVGSPPDFTGTIHAYASDIGFTSRPWDDPPSQHYPAIITKLPTFRREMGASLSGPAPVSFGEMAISNPRPAGVGSTSAGERDDWARVRWERDYIKQWLGDPSWPKHDFRQILIGRLGQPTASQQEELLFKISDLSDALNVPLTATRISGGNYDGQFMPKVVGTAFYSEPPETDTVTREYTFDEGAISIPTGFTGYVYDNFILDNATSVIASVAGNVITTVDPHGLLVDWRVRFGGTPPSPLVANVDYYVISSGLTTTAFKVSATLGGTEITLLDTTAGASIDGLINHFDLPNGKMYLASANVGRITSQAIRKNTGTGTEDRVSEMYAYILYTLAGISQNFKDTASFAALQTLMASGSTRAGMWFDTQAHQCREAIDKLAAGTNTWYGQTIDGLFQVGRFDLPTSSPVLYLSESDIKLASLRLESVMLPVDMTSAQVTFAPHFYTQGPGQGAISPIFFQLKSFAPPYDYGAAGIPLDSYPNAMEAQVGKVFETLFTTGGVTERNRLAMLWLKKSGVWTVETTLRALMRDDSTFLALNDTISLEHSRLGWKEWTASDPASPDNLATIDSRLAVVVGIDINMDADAYKVKLKLWRPMPGYYPESNLN